MVGVPSVRRARGSGIVVALLLAASPAPAAAADGSIVLAADSLATMVADLDGDGVREVVAARRHPDGGNDLVVEAWGERGGSWTSLGSSRIERWSDEEPGPQPARFGREGVGLLALRDGPRTRAMIATVSQAGEFGGGCCLSLSSVELGQAGLSVELVEGTLGSAEVLQVLDMEGDGVDEMIGSATIAIDEQGMATSEYALYRRVGSGFDRVPLEMPLVESTYLAGVGDSDGIAGDDLLFVDTAGSTLIRVSAADRELLTEREDLGELDINIANGWVAGAANGIIALVTNGAFKAVRWPRAGNPEGVASLGSVLSPNLIALGEGPGARWIDLSGVDPSSGDVRPIRIRDRDLSIEAEITVPTLTRQLWEMSTRGTFFPSESNRYLWESAGPIPLGLGPERPAFLGHGSLITIEADGSLATRPAATLVGAGMLGAAGAGHAWLAVSGDFTGFGRSAYLGNIGYEPPYGIVALIPFRDILDPGELDRAAIRFGGATVADGEEGATLYTTDDAFQVTVSGAAGDVVVAYAERTSTTAEISGSGSVTVTVDPPGRKDANREFDLSVFVVGRTGLTRAITWPAHALRVAPEVTATAEVDPFALTATITGQVDGIGTVTVDGLPVTPSPSGRFRVEVDAPAWPRDVLVVTRDPLGNESTQRLEVIGFIDYRGLPWIPIIGALTVVAGIVLFVRTPRLRPEERLRPDGDGRLEEIDGDLI